MKVGVLGADGYTGWPLVCRLLDHGHEVVGIDNGSAREYRGNSVTPIETQLKRYEAANECFDPYYGSYEIDITNFNELATILQNTKPDAIVNVAQIPSAPFSMVSPERSWFVQRNNVRGSLNLMWALKNLDMTDTHVVQLATMGEYGTPDDPIPEGFLDDGRPAPKMPGSLYHASKVQTTANTRFLAETWGIPVTEIYQGIVYGATTRATDGDPRLNTRFDADEQFGTVTNRFTAQTAIGHPLTVYGDGGQKRAMLSLQDCVRCLQLVLEHPPAPDAPGREPYRAVNQFDGAHRVMEVAEYLRDEHGATIEHYENPRKEDDSEHFYEVERNVLDELGYEPDRTIWEEIDRTLPIVAGHAGRIDAQTIEPETTWD